MENQNDGEYDEIKIGDPELKFNDATNLSKSFGFCITNKNIQVSVVLIKRLWKRRANITKYMKKKSIKRKSKQELIKQETKTEESNIKTNDKHVEEFKTMNPEEISDRKWCWSEYERHIGVPKRRDTNPKSALKYLRMKRYQRLVREARNFERPRDPDSVFLSWDKPINKCLCRDKECFCSKEEKKIPDDLRPNGLKKGFSFFKKKTETTTKDDAKNFIDKLVAATGGSTPKKEGASKRVILNPDLCIHRCLHYHITGELQNLEYVPYFVLQSLQEKNALKSTRRIEEDKDDRVCNAFSCTVSTQTETLPSGELNIKKFQHLLYSNNENTYLSDIRGKKLQITHYKHVSSPGPDMQVCVRNMEKLLDVKEMKFRFSKFLSSICEIKDLGPPVRTCATQVPWRQRIYDSIKYRAPNRCGDKDYDNIPVVPWSAKIDKLINERMLDDTRKKEFEEDQNDEVCPCCELFVGSDIDKEALFDNFKNVLNLPQDVRVSKSDDKNQLADQEVDKTAEEFDENINKMDKVIESVPDGNEEGDTVTVKMDNIEKCPQKCCDQPINQKKDNTELKNEENENIIDMPLYDKESVDKNILDTNEMIEDNDNSALISSVIVEGTASNEMVIEEKSNVKKTVKCDFLRQKKLHVTGTESVTSNQNNKNGNEIDNEIDSSNTNSKNDNHGIEINLLLSKSDQMKHESKKDLSVTDKINENFDIANSKIMIEQKISLNIQNTSKDKIVHQVNTSNKKVSSVFSSLFKWLFDQKSLFLNQIKTKISLKSVSKDQSSTDDTKLNERDSKASEREVFSMRYTNSIINVSKSSSSETDK